MCHLEGTLNISASSSEKMAHIWNEREYILAELCRYALTWADREYTALRTTSALGIKEQSKADPVSIQFPVKKPDPGKAPSAQSFLQAVVIQSPSWTAAYGGTACIGVPVTETRGAQRQTGELSPEHTDKTLMALASNDWLLTVLIFSLFLLGCGLC